MPVGGHSALFSASDYGSAYRPKGRQRAIYVFILKPQETFKDCHVALPPFAFAPSPTPTPAYKLLLKFTPNYAEIYGRHGTIREITKIYGDVGTWNMYPTSPSIFSPISQKGVMTITQLESIKEVYSAIIQLRAPTYGLNVHSLYVAIQAHNLDGCTFNDVTHELWHIAKYLRLRLTTLQIDFHGLSRANKANLDDWNLLRLTSFPNLKKFTTITIPHNALISFLDIHESIEDRNIGGCTYQRQIDCLLCTGSR